MKQLAKNLLTVAIIPCAIGIFYLFGESFVDSYLEDWGFNSWLFTKSATRTIYYGALGGAAYWGHSL